MVYMHFSVHVHAGGSMCYHRLFPLPTEIIPWGGGLLLADGVLEDPWELLGHSACIARTRRCAQTT